MSDKDLTRLIIRKLALADTYVEGLLKTADKRLLAEYKASLDAIRLELAKLYEKLGGNITRENALQYNRLSSLEAQIAAEIKRLNVVTRQIITGSLKDVFATNYYNTAYAFESSMSLKLGFGLLAADVIKASVLNPLDRITWIERAQGWNQDAYNKIRSAITQGLIKGEGYGKIGKAIKDRLDITAGRAVLIARTEGHRVQSVARLQAFEKTEAACDRLGVEVLRIWTATLDAKTRPDHQDADGQAADEDGMYNINGITTEAPGLSGIPEFDINCRCTERTEVKGYESNIRKDNITKELIPNMTYKEWYNLRIAS
jgi:uncharacterized protein with gpF-like domain